MKLIYLFMIVVLFIGNLWAVSLNTTYMKSEFSRYGVYNQVPNADEVFGSIVKYFTGGKLYDGFNDREKSHMADVKRWYIISNIVFYLSLAALFILIYFRLKENVWQKLGLILQKTSYICMIFFGLFITLVITSFDKVFLWMHKLLFKSGTWTFDPSSEVLIQVFRGEIFFDIARTIIILVFFELIIILMAGLILNRRSLWMFRPLHILAGLFIYYLGCLVTGIKGAVIYLGMIPIAFLILGSFFFYDHKNRHLEKNEKSKSMRRTYDFDVKKAAIAHYILAMIFSFLLNIALFIFVCFVVIGTVIFSIYMNKRKAIEKK